MNYYFILNYSYIVPGLVSFYYFFTLVQQGKKGKFLPKVKM